MGSFSKTFASNGGFVASNHPALKQALRSSCGPLTFSNALSPVAATIVLKALDIVESSDGAKRRRRLRANAVRLREGLKAGDCEVLGEPSAIVPVIVGDTPLARLATRFATESGALVNLVEHPVVALNRCRWRLQVMADHTDVEIDEMIRIGVAAKARAAALLA
jgi:glycine C-acetyltransferase